MGRRPRVGAAATLVALAVAVAACAPASGSEPPERTVQVRLRYSRFHPGTFAFAPGTTVTFVVTNGDPIDHEVIIGDEGVQLAHERGTEAFHPPRPGEMTVPAGQTRTTTYTFGSSDLIIGCHLPGHYAYGMRARIRIG
jgi:uncharacterized cupredoxin-like copper-binding protein